MRVKVSRVTRRECNVLGDTCTRKLGRRNTSLYRDCLDLIGEHGGIVWIFEARIYEGVQRAGTCERDISRVITRADSES